MFPLWVPDVSPPGRNSSPEQNRDREKQLCKTYALGEGQHVMIFLLVPLGVETEGKDQILPIGSVLKARKKKKLARLEFLWLSPVGFKHHLDNVIFVHLVS